MLIKMDEMQKQAKSSSVNKKLGAGYTGTVAISVQWQSKELPSDQGTS